MRRRMPLENRVLMPLHFNVTVATRVRIERYAEERGISLGAALREIITEGMARTGAVGEAP